MFTTAAESGAIWPHFSYMLTHTPICSAFRAKIAVLARYFSSPCIRIVSQMSSLWYLLVQPPASTPSPGRAARGSHCSAVPEVTFVGLTSQRDVLAVILHLHQRKSEKSKAMD